MHSYRQAKFNIGHCISAHIANSGGPELAPELAHVWSCPLSMDLSRHGGVVDNNIVGCFDGLSYLETTNCHALESFSSNGNFVIQYYHTNKSDEIEWLSNQSRQGIKFLVKIRNADPVCTKKSKIEGPSVLALISYKQANYSSADFNPYLSPLSVEVSEEQSYEIKGEIFNSLWISEKSENFNANRYILIPASFDKKSDYVKRCTQISLLSQYNILRGSHNRGLRSVILLKKHLVESEDSFLHQVFLQNSFSGDKAYVDHNAGRLDFSEAVRMLKETDVIGNDHGVEESYRHSAEVWRAISKEVSEGNMVDVVQLSEMYDELLNAELMGCNSLEKLVKNGMS